MDSLDLCRRELESFGEQPSQLIRRLLTSPRIKVAGFGESHRWNNPHRQLLAGLIPSLRELGFTHLCLEIGPEFQAPLDEFARGNIQNVDLEALLVDAGASLYQNGIPCPAYFSLLQRARDCGMQIIAIDKDRTERFWFHPEYAQYPREQFQADRVMQVLAEASINRAIVLGGANHMYIRRPAIQSAHLSMTEHLSNRLTQCGDSFAALGGVIYTEARVPDLTFEPLYSLLAPATACAVMTSACANLSSFLLGRDRRCPWGACFETNIDSCAGITFDICQAIPMSDILAGFWDVLVFHKRDWQVNTL
ncbi:MAG: hypothetical protein DKT66_14120 [Candidatus Melainabacteria bacterium]|nr:MAG: hypothetical protein DKT66_14120 [Candidatus Melainabacteria bacterium]